MMVVHRKDSSTSSKIPDRPMLGFRNSEKVEGIPNKISPLVITVTVRQFYIHQILTECSSSYDIMYSKLFKKMGFDRGRMWVV